MLKYFVRYDKDGDAESLKWANCITALILGIILLFIVIAYNPFYTVAAGHRGVALRFGAVKMEPYGEGLHFLLPFIQATEMVKMDVQVQALNVKAAAASKDLQNVHSTVVLNYHVVPDKTPQIYKNLGLYYWQTIISPQIQEVFKATTAHYNATELITQRERVRSEAKEAITKRLAAYDIMVDDFAIVDFQFDVEFAKSIEAKQIAEMKIQTERNILESTKIKAEGQITAARGEAEANRLRTTTVTPELTRWEAIKKWDGKLPYYTGGGVVPFIDISK